MNFFKAEVHGSELLAAGGSIQISSAADGSYTLGVRPEDILVSEDGRFVCSVEVVETLGSEKVVIGTAESGEPVTARCRPDTDVSPGGQIRFEIDSSRVHLFATDGVQQKI
jgi:ABC-type sugar transport system ATPase subunit